MGKWVEAAKKMRSKDGLQLEVSLFPYKYDENGRCENLGEDNKCKIYATRPDVCDIKKIFEKHYKYLINRKDFYDLSEKACLKLQANRIISPK
jgi:Fe-S-cluster containining protein